MDGQRELEHFAQQLAREILSRHSDRPQECLLVCVIGGGQIVGKDGTLKTRLAEVLCQELEKASPELKIAKFSTDAYLYPFEFFGTKLRGVAPNQYNWERLIADIRHLKKDKGEVTIQEYVHGEAIERQIGPHLDVLIFEGICSALAPDVKGMADICIGVIEETNQEYLKKEVERLTKQGYTEGEVLNTFAQTQFTVRQDIFARELREKADFVLRLDEDPPKMYSRSRQ